MKLKTISREDQLEKLRKRYVGRGVEGKSRILDELCEQYGYHRILDDDYRGYHDFRETFEPALQLWILLYDFLPTRFMDRA
jgi:hypothetical protein